MKLAYFRRKTKIGLGATDDQGTFDAPIAILESEGADLCDKKWAMAGSIEISTWKYQIGKEKVDVEFETVQGIEISGEKEVVERIADAVRRKRSDNSIL